MKMQIMINGYTYQSDSLGRIVSTSGRLVLGNKAREMSDKINIIGKGDERDTDDRGHLIGHQFSASDEMENLVPQDSGINQGIYRQLEMKLRVALENGSKVNVAVMPFYTATSYRPNGILYFYDIDGTKRITLFPNESK